MNIRDWYCLDFCMCEKEGWKRGVGDFNKFRIENLQWNFGFVYIGVRWVQCTCSSSEYFGFVCGTRYDLFWSCDGD